MRAWEGEWATSLGSNRSVAPAGLRAGQRLQPGMPQSCYGGWRLQLSVWPASLPWVWLSRQLLYVAAIAGSHPRHAGLFATS